MSEFEDELDIHYDDEFVAPKERTLLIDGDIIIYRPCCIFNEDSDSDRGMIAKKINDKIEELMIAAGCTKYIMFVTTKFNVRDYYVDDYKANRQDVDRPVNLAWAKRWSTQTLNTHFRRYLEADDLLGIHQTEDTVIWSLDKDLRQIAGSHLDDDTMEVVKVTHGGLLRTKKWVTESGKKKEGIYFNGMIGFYYQLLIGDSTDWIVGCGKRVKQVYKSGAKKGQSYIKRDGIGPKAAMKILSKATSLEGALELVKSEYYKIHGKDWQEHLETQGNLLWMVRYQDDAIIQRWTYDGREEYFNIDTGLYDGSYTKG